jgi:ABC-2 type transport system ATP-binding protein
LTKIENHPAESEPETAFPQRLPLTVDNLKVRLKGFELGPLSFYLKPGQVTVLLGHNGAGKTTTMRLLIGLIRKDQGSVTLGSLTQDDEIAYRNRIGFVPEEAFYYRQMTVAQLVKFTSTFYPDWDATRCRKLGEMLALDFSKKIRHLSKGTRMKLSLLLALTRNPDVLLLDEPTSGLDPRSRAEVLKMIKSAAQTEGQAVLFSTHNLGEAEQVADHLLVVDRGHVIASEEMSAIKARIGSLESYYLGLVQ